MLRFVFDSPVLALLGRVHAGDVQSLAFQVGLAVASQVDLFVDAEAVPRSQQYHSWIVPSPTEFFLDLS